MSVIVRMEMPDWCPCELAIDNNGWFSPCFAYDGIPSRDKEFDDCVENRKRPSWCPIIGVLPEQHGRIIDEAVFCENVVKYSHQSTKTIGKALDATPTIIDMTPIVAERSET